MSERPNILEAIDEFMAEGYSEDDAATMWYCLYADNDEFADYMDAVHEDEGYDRWEVDPSRDDWDE